MRKILVLRGGALGDFIVTLPALALLRSRWPAARLELAGNATAATLALDARLIDAAHSQHEARWSALFSRAPLPGDFGAWLAEFDLVVNYWPDPDGELRSHFPVHAGQTFLQGEAQPNLAPAASSYGEPLRALGLATTEHFFPLTTETGACVGGQRDMAHESVGRRPLAGDSVARPPGDAAAIARKRAPTSNLSLRPPSPPHRIALHPGSGSPRKNWPLDRWAALCEWLGREHHAELLVITGEAESAAARALGRFGTAAHTLPLRDLAAQLASCGLFLGHDSGVSHLAAACRVPSVLLFGPTDPAMWAPPAPHVRMLRRGDTTDAILLEEVQHEVAARINARKNSPAP